MRRRRSSNASSGMSSWNGRISVPVSTIAKPTSRSSVDPSIGRGPSHYGERGEFRRGRRTTATRRTIQGGRSQSPRCQSMLFTTSVQIRSLTCTAKWLRGNNMPVIPRDRAAGLVPTARAPVNALLGTRARVDLRLARPVILLRGLAARAGSLRRFQANSRARSARDEKKPAVVTSNTYADLQDFYGSDGTRTRYLRRDGPVLVVPGWAEIGGDSPREQGV